MRRIAFYISDHGFGHASRNIPLIRYILESDNNIEIFIKTGIKQGRFIKDSIKKEFYKRVNFYYENTDIGIILKKNSLDIDRNLLEEKVLKYIETWREREKLEELFLLEMKIKLVITDVVPWILNVTSYLNIKSIVISNFTWVDIYKEHLSAEIIKKYIEAYKKSDRFFIYDLEIDSMYEYIKNYKKFGIVCREFSKEKVINIKNKYKKKIVFVTVGRSVDLKTKIDVNKLDYHFIVTEGINLIGDNVTCLNIETNNTQDYIKASDFIITKAGWGTLSEALIANKKMAVIEREGVSEDREVIRKLLNKGLAIKIKSKFNIIEVLERLETFHKNKEIEFDNEYINLSKSILNEIYEG